jgi:hypothetical protein
MLPITTRTLCMGNKGFSCELKIYFEFSFWAFKSKTSPTQMHFDFIEKLWQ